jgi:hypothetical protein
MAVHPHPPPRGVEWEEFFPSARPPSWGREEIGSVLFRRRALMITEQGPGPDLTPTYLDLTMRRIWSRRTPLFGPATNGRTGCDTCGTGRTTTCEGKMA